MTLLSFLYIKLNLLAENTPVLHAHLCADEVVVVAIEPRTGRVNLRDTGDFGAAGRGPRFTAISEKLNENPMVLLDALIGLRLNVSIFPCQSTKV
jgi:mediator of RNA polymerase II transcription subunit 14